MPTPISTDHVIETLGIAADENKIDARRSGQTVHLKAESPEAEIWISGDMHDHRRNFEKFVRAADLANYPHRHVVLHELIHGDHYDASGAEDSWEMLVRAAELKADHPRQVLFLLANHDLAQIHGEGIMKGGLSVCEAFNKGIRRDFGDRQGTVQAAITEFLLSFPLAIRTSNGLFICHSIPANEEIANFDYTVFDRELTGPDYKRRVGPVYQLIWGRKMTPESASAFAEKVKAQLLITGHQPQEAGYAVNGDRQIILASDHNQGVFLRLSLTETYTMDALVDRLQRFVTLDV
jgi:hypothetical protein